MPHSSRSSPDSQLASGVVELREDLPLKAGGSGAAGGARCCAGGPRLILAAFAALTAAITLALLTQIYYGDFELVPHGSVSSSAAACSRAGTDALKAGGRALDAAVAAAMCLAVLAPHRTSFDASGALLYWEYRNARTSPPVLYEWGGAVGAGGGERPPRLVAALATLHAQLGTLPWQQLLTPAIQLAKDGYVVSDGLAAAAAAVAGAGGTGSYAAGSVAAAPSLADYLASLLPNTSAELSAVWKGAALVRHSEAHARAAGAWRMLVAGAGAPAARALAAALTPAPDSPDDAQRRVLESLQGEARAGALAAGGTATGLAAVDRYDTYVALVTVCVLFQWLVGAVRVRAGHSGGMGARRTSRAARPGARHPARRHRLWNALRAGGGVDERTGASGGGAGGGGRAGRRRARACGRAPHRPGSGGRAPLAPTRRAARTSRAPGRPPRTSQRIGAVRRREPGAAARRRAGVARRQSRRRARLSLLTARALSQAHLSRTL